MVPPLGQLFGLLQRGRVPNHRIEAVLGSHFLLQISHPALKAGFFGGAVRLHDELVVGVALLVR